MNRNSQSNLSSGSHKSGALDLICRIKYQNKLPDIPFEPKSIVYPFDSNRYIEYKSTSLEKNFKWDILNEQDLGIRIDLINQDYNKLDQDTNLHPDDEKLLEEDTVSAADLKRAEQHNKTVSWMRRNEYISAENTRFQPKQYDSAESKVGYSVKKKLKETDYYKDRDSQIAAIEQGFEATKKQITKHYSKPGVFAQQELQIFPDFDLWRHSSAQVLFDDDPTSKSDSMSKQQVEMSQALIKGLVDKNGEQFVAYFLPTQETVQKRHRDDENETEYDADDEYDFKLSREYTWNIKSKSSHGYEENYFFIIKDNGVFYNELETRVRLSKRRTKFGKVGNTKLNVKYRPFTRQEEKNQRTRLRDLENISGEDESDEEQEQEAEQNEESHDTGDETGEQHTVEEETVHETEENSD